MACGSSIRNRHLHVDAPFCGKKVLGFLGLKPEYSGDLGSHGNNTADPYFKEKLEVYSFGRISMNQHGLITKD
ncbi:hypothetical protein AAVH_17487 [Aphelenchoides avenae]|nr:hypothetical protein AAVH_17487 [Aphelenchus avenae]